MGTCSSVSVLAGPCGTGLVMGQSTISGTSSARLGRWAPGLASDKQPLLGKEPSHLPNCLSVG